MWEETVFAWVSQYGYWGLACLLALGIVGLPIPDETLLTFAGFLVYSRRLSFVPALTAAFLGSGTGITLSYVLGRSFGAPLIHRYGRYFGLTEARLMEVHQWFERAGRWSLTFGYFVPGVRHFTAYAAGMSDLEPHSFALFAYCGAALWSLTFISLGWFLGEQWHTVLHRFHQHAWKAAAGLAALAAVGIAAHFWRRSRRR